MFRVFRLLPKLSHEAKRVKVEMLGEWVAGHVQGVQAFAQTFSRGKSVKVEMPGDWLAGHVQGVQAFAQTFSRGKSEFSKEG
jgi:hypothetical protein